MSKLEGQVRGTREIINVYSDTLTELGEKVYDESDLRESWLERNVAAEGEVTILRERVDEQDRKIEELEKTLAQALQLLAEFNSPAPAGKFFIFSKFQLLIKPVAGPSSGALPIVIDVDALPSSPPSEQTSAPEVMLVPVNEVVLQSMPVGDTGEEGDAVLDEVPVTTGLEGDAVPDVVLADNEAPANAVPVAIFSSLEQVSADDGAPALASSIPSSSEMPPPNVPSPLGMQPPDVPSSQVPQVNLLPPTPNTSQEAANSGPTTLLKVPDPTNMPDPLPSNAPSRSRSRSRSPAPDSSEVRRSPRLTSPTPSTKRPASDVLEEPAANKPKQ